MAGHTELIVRVAQTLSHAANRLSELFAVKNHDEK
jgi:hypothetical protein